MREFPRHYCFLDALPRIRYHIRNARVAQWIERLPPEQKAVGSSPSPRTIFTLVSQRNENARLNMRRAFGHFDNHRDNHRSAGMKRYRAVE
jgi:hypothetical protein